MSKLKFLVGGVVVIAALFTVLALNVLKSESAREAKDIGVEVMTTRISVSKKEIKLYRSRQERLQKALAGYFKKAIQSGTMVGAGVSIVKGDSILISEGYGKRSIGGAAGVDGETVFRLGSLSKGFGGVLMADLKQEGQLDFNDKVVEYLPEFKFGDEQHTQKVKLSHILSHTSGTPYHSFTNLVEAGLSVEKIASRFNEVKPISEPGQMYSYQNAMFSLSQEVVRRATGKDVKTLLRKRFFEPLGMSSISMDHSTLLEGDNVAMPHSKRRKGWRSLPLRDRYYNAVVAGGINASSLDMAKWMRFLLGHRPEVMPKDAIQDVFEPFVALNYNNKYYQRWQGHVQSSYGFGWRIHEFQQSDSPKKTTVWHHGGSVNNYRNEIALFPDTDLGICVLLNGNSKLARNVIPDLYRIVKDIQDQFPAE